MRKLRYSIEMGVPGAQVVCWVGRRTSFEVVVDGALIHSKLQTRKLPDFEEALDIIKNIAAGEEPRKVMKMQNSCNIL